MTWDQWAKRHALAFGMAGEKDGAMLCEWTKRFEAAGYTTDELATASEWLILHPERWPAQQLDALTGFVRDRRLRDRNAAEADARRAAITPLDASCGLCGGTGVVAGLTVVKRYGGVRRGTGCVSCRCPDGVRLADLRELAGFPLARLGDVERTRPDWRDEKPEEKAAMPAGLGLAYEAGAVIAKAEQARQGRAVVGK